MIERPDRAAFAILALHNLVQNHLLNERGYVTGNLVVTGGLVGLGRSAGLSWEEMGLHPDRVKPGLRLGARTAAAAVASALIALAHPLIRSYLRDERARVASAAELWRRALLRFPLGTALFEEVAFRGVLPALLGRRHRQATADAISATAFALWHLIPTGRALAGNPLHLGLTSRRRAGYVVAGSALAGAFGLSFSGLRRRSGSVAAPWLAHSALNTVSFLIGVAAWQLAQPRVEPGSRG